MTTWDYITAFVIFYLGYGMALLRHDTDQWAWQIPWLVGENRRAHTRLRRLEAHVGLPAEPDPPDPGKPPSMIANLRADLRDLAATVGRRSRRLRFWLRTPPGTRHQPADADAPTARPEPPATEPMPVQPRGPATPRRPAPAPGPATVPTAAVIADAWQQQSDAWLTESLAALDHIAAQEEPA